MKTKPQHQPTEETRAEVTALISFGVPQDGVAEYIGVDAKTLRKHYRKEIDLAATHANAQVGKFLYKSATGAAMELDGASHSDCLRAAIFWAKTKMGFKETGALEVTGKDGGPVQTIDVTKLSTQALAELVAARNAKTTDTE